MNGPPSSGHDVITGSSSRRTSEVTRSTTGPPDARRVPTLSSSRPTSRASHSFAAVGGSSVSARCTRRLISCSGRVPNASSARRAVPNRLVTSRNRDPLTFVKSSAGPPAAITRRWISATSRWGSTDASTVTMALSRRSRSMNERKSGNTVLTTKNATFAIFAAFAVHRVSFRYLMRCGVSAAAPRRR